MGILKKIQDSFSPKTKKHKDSEWKRSNIRLDGYIEGPFAHHKNATETDRESEYFMQYVHQRKLHRIAIKTPVGYRVTYGFAGDVWNNQLGVRLETEELTYKINNFLTDYLKSRKAYQAFELANAYKIEQGEGIILLHCADIKNAKDYEQYEKPVDPREEILEYEAYNKIHYRIVEWDDRGEPEYYQIMIKGSTGMGSGGPSKRYIRVHASRVERLKDKELYRRGYGYGKLAVMYDEIVILSNIIKASGEAAYRFGTGHPLILTKDITDGPQLEKIKNMIGTPTRRSWHVLPSEFIDRFDLIGQAGQMLNLDALANIVLDQIVILSKIPRPILMGEVAGVVQGSEVNERSYFAALDEEHTDLEPFIRRVFNRDINIKKLLNGFDWEFNWGIREVLNKMDQAKFDQIQISNALALTSIITINEARARVGIDPLPDQRGELILSLGIGPPSDTSQIDETNNISSKSEGTKKQEKISKDIEKDKTVINPKIQMRENKAKVSDAIRNLRDSFSVNEICEMFNIGKQTFYKIQKLAEEKEI